MKGRLPDALVKKVGREALLKISPNKQKLVNKPMMCVHSGVNKGKWEAMSRYAKRKRGEMPEIEYIMSVNEALKKAGLEPCGDEE